MRQAAVLRLTRNSLMVAASIATLCAGPGDERCRGFSSASAEEWRPIVVAPGPQARRQEGLIVDPTSDRLIVVGGEHSDGGTWALNLTGPPAWANLGFAAPGEAADVVRAVYDSQDHKMLLIVHSMAVYALDLINPAGWTLVIGPGTGPVGRGYPAIAYDSLRNRLLVFGGGPDTGVYSDVWALSLTGTPAWQQLAPSPGPNPRWAAVAVYDEADDQLVVATGSGALITNDIWVLPLASPTAWAQVVPSGSLPQARYLSAAVYSPSTHELVMFGGNNGSVGLKDVWSLNLTHPTAWRLHTFANPTPVPEWSHMLAYRPSGAELITYGGWDGGNYRSDVWALPQEPVTGPPSVFGFSPLGGKIGDEVLVTGARLDSPTQVTIGGAVASVVSSAFGSLRATVPAGAVTGPIAVSNSFGTGTSSGDFFVGESPEVASFSPDSGRVGQEVVIHGNHLATTAEVRFGGTGSADILSKTDTEVHAVVDSLASSGPIHLNTLAGSTVSANSFLVTADDPRPHLLSVRDVRGDQGGKVLLRWRASDFDQARYKLITGYRVWRRAPLTDVTASARPAAALSGLPQVGPGAFWEGIAELPAAFLKGYAFAAPTLSDSSEAGNPYTAYFVQALTADPFVFYNSSPDSGYSVDNLSPPAPAPLAVLYGPSANAMHWHASSAADLRGYELYRGNSSTFLPSAATLVATTAETSYTDGPGASYYKLAAVDIHGNRSRFVAVAPDVPVGTLASLVDSRRLAGHVQLSWYSGGNSGMQADVQRRTETGEWTTLAVRSVDGSGFLRFDDGTVEDGVRYAYRLAILDNEGVESAFTSESWFEPLVASRLSLAIVANPSVGGRIVLGLTLPSAASANVSLFDLAGRELERQDVRSGTDGRADATLGSSIRLRPGLYMIRATAAGMTVTKRVAVIF
jgi:hypothetical protein